MSFKFVPTEKFERNLCQKWEALKEKRKDAKEMVAFWTTELCELAWTLRNEQYKEFVDEERERITERKLYFQGVMHGAEQEMNDLLVFTQTWPAINKVFVRDFVWTLIFE